MTMEDQTEFLSAAQENPLYQDWIGTRTGIIYKFKGFGSVKIGWSHSWQRWEAKLSRTADDHTFVELSVLNEDSIKFILRHGAWEYLKSLGPLGIKGDT